MKFWAILAWAAYMIGVLIDHFSDPGTPHRTDAVYFMVMACFFMLCSVKEHLTTKSAR